MYEMRGRQVDGEVNGRFGRENKIHSVNKPSPCRKFYSVDSEVVDIYSSALLILCSIYFAHYICYILYEWPA